VPLLVLWIIRNFHYSRSKQDYRLNLPWSAPHVDTNQSTGVDYSLTPDVKTEHIFFLATYQYTHENEMRWLPPA
jgi:hypothetical protein